MADVIVTGASGFIGHHLSAALARGGNDVLALDLAPRHGPAEPGLRFEQVDIRDTARLRSFLHEGATVYHLASRHLEVGLAEDEYVDVNVDAAVRLVEACSDAGVHRLVHTSTVGIYGHVEDPPATEDAPRDPGNVYERTKLRGERAVLARAGELGVDTVVVRPAWVYGPGCPRTAKLLRAVRKGRFFFVGGGRNLRHPVHIDDMIAGFLAAAAAPAPLPRPDYIIAGPGAVTLRELVETAARVQGSRPPRLDIPRPAFIALAATLEAGFSVIGREPPVSRRTLTFFENDNAFDTSAAQADLGYRPTIDLEEGLRQTMSAERAEEVVVP